MTFNEINNQANYEEDFAPLLTLVLLTRKENREAIMYQAAHYELVASACSENWPRYQSRLPNWLYDCDGAYLSLFL